MIVGKLAGQMRVLQLGVVMALVIVWASALVAQVDGPTGQSQQALIGGSLVSPEKQEYYTLLSLSTGCSASLLRNEWVITAAHCVDDPDPNNAGQFIVVPDTSITVTANWRTEQKRKSLRIITFRPLDVAIIRVSQPFERNGSTTNFNRGIFQEGQFPYFGTPVGVPIMVFGRGIYQFSRKTPTGDMPSRRDGQYRVGYFRTTSQDNDSGMRYWYPAMPNQSLGGGDSGGPSFTQVLNDSTALVGVHSSCDTTCLPGHKCGTWKGPGPVPPDYNIWDWVNETPRCADAPIAPVWDDINRYLGAFTGGPREPALEPPAPGYIGTFGTSPPNYQPMWVYGIKPDGDLLWYRKDTGNSPWQGPKSVGAGWAGYRDVIPAGGNSVYALGQDGRLWWFQHNGFNDGGRSWRPQVEVGRGWTFKKIFAGGEGIVYAVRDDGTLLWYRHGGWADGRGIDSWIGPKVVGSGWQNFIDIFSMGEGKIYAVNPDGSLLFYQHLRWQTGDSSWTQPRTVGSGWQAFRQIVSVGDGVILAIDRNGKLIWFKHSGRVPTGSGPSAQLREVWEGPIEIGSGWHGFKRIFTLMPVATVQGPR